MTFYFGFATDDAFYLAADRRRVQETPVQKVDDSKTKLHKVNRWTYLTGAGFLYFVDEVVAPQSRDVFGDGRQDTDTLEQDLPRLSDQLTAIFEHVVGQTGVAKPEQLYSKFSLVGLGASGQPFSIEWNSEQGFVGLAIAKRHFFCLPQPEPEENEALHKMISRMQEVALRGANLKALALEAKQIVSWVAERDETVSLSGDIVCIGQRGNKNRTF